MSQKNLKVVVLSAAAVVAGVACAEVMDRPTGIRLTDRMTLKPYVSVSATFDSNVEGRKDGAEDVVWKVNPGLGLDYKAETWYVNANAYYQYNAYSKKVSSSTLSYHGYGENLTFNWTDSMPGEKGWTLMLTEGYQRINQIDDMMVGDSSYTRDRDELKFAAALQRRFTSQIHANVNADYYWLDYDNSNNGPYGLYGWSRWRVGAELGYAASRWTDILVAGSYQGYHQDNSNPYYRDSYRSYDKDSDGWTLQAGLGSYATERITYRVLAGWSRFSYAGGTAEEDGFVYTVSGFWKISDTWNTMLMATSYYQPSEREYGSSQRVDALSWGLAHTMIRGKLSATLDLSYRRETHEYSATSGSDYDIDVITGRLGLNYTVNRYLGLFGNIEYRRSFSDGERGDYYDYDRYRLALGVRFTY